jgi:hypothetical protein
MIPQHELEALAETLYPAIKEFFENEQGQTEFKAWQEQQRNLQEGTPRDNKATNEG